MGRIIERNRAASVVADWKSAGRRVVFTNGCFDLIHVGHVRTLTEARKRGDALVVGLNSDESVARLKPGRPLVPEGERAELLAALACVDAVVIFDEDTPYELIKALGPHVLVKGGDWAVSRIVGHDLVPQTESLPFQDGYSTTDLLRRIRGLSDLD